MDKERINEYSVRIAQSSRAELVAISCEIAAEYMSDGKRALKDGEREQFCFCIKKAMSFVDDLASNLDMAYAISGNLMSLYIYVKKILIHANAVYTDEKLDSAVRVMTSIGNAFESVAQQDKSAEKLMEGSEQIYTGYTYGKNSRLNEYVVRNK